MRFFRITATSACLCALAPIAGAQDQYQYPAGPQDQYQVQYPDQYYDAPPAHLAYLQGDVTLDREDASEPATSGSPIVSGDRLRTSQGRGAVEFPDGSMLDIDEYSSFEIQGPDLIRVNSGRVLLTVFGASDPRSAIRFQIDTPAASVRTDGPGTYRVSLIPDGSGLATELAVIRGVGELATDRGTMPLRAGELSIAYSGGPPSRAQAFNTARVDAFDRWALDHGYQPTASRSAQYLPSELRMYGGDLDRYGAWRFEAPYGYVWYPTVASSWRPYYDGYWDPVPNYGWTWIGVDPWSWPTHHYGRWGNASNRWFWIPDRRWAPAWVSWGAAPGYVSWCPLGYNNRPVFALSTSTGRSWAGWTVISRDHFETRGFGRPRRNVHQFAVSPRSIPVNTPFVAQATAPVRAPRAVPRNAGGRPFGQARSAPFDAGRPAGTGSGGRGRS